MAVAFDLKRDSPNHPAHPQVKNAGGPRPGTLVESGRASPAEIQRYFIRLNDEDANAIESNSKSLWVYGYVAFRDLLGTRHESSSALGGDPLPISAILRWDLSTQATPLQSTPATASL